MGHQAIPKPYGFLTFPDWQKIQSAIQTITIGAVATVPNVNGATLDSTGAGTRVLTLHPADATNAGIVTAGAQTFGGDKTFDNVSNCQWNHYVEQPGRQYQFEHGAGKQQWRSQKKGGKCIGIR